jgi:hypothetical protein
MQILEYLIEDAFDALLEFFGLQQDGELVATQPGDGVLPGSACRPRNGRTGR